MDAFFIQMAFFGCQGACLMLAAATDGMASMTLWVASLFFSGASIGALAYGKWNGRE